MALSSAVLAFPCCCPCMLTLSSGLLVVFMFLIMVCARLSLPNRDPRIEEVPDGLDVMTEANGIHGEED